MGQTTSTNINETVNKKLNEAITNVNNTTHNLVKNISDINQQVKIDASGLDVECTSTEAGKGFIDISQVAKMNFLTKIEDSQTLELKNQLKDIISNMAKQNTESAGGIGGGAKSENINKIYNDIQNIVETNITTTTYNESINAVNVNQDANIIFNNAKYKGPCPFIDINSLTDLQLSNLVSNLSNQISQVISESETTTETDQTAKSSNSLFDFGNSIIIIAVIISIVILFIVPSSIKILIILALLAIGFYYIYITFINPPPNNESYVNMSNYAKTNQVWNCPNYYYSY